MVWRGGRGRVFFYLSLRLKQLVTPGIVHLWKAEDNAVLNHSAMHSIFADSVSLFVEPMNAKYGAIKSFNFCTQ